MVRWALALLPAYVLMQVVPLPVALVRVLSPARAEALAALDRIGAQVNFASLSVSPAATFQSFLLVCGYVIIFLLVRELTWRFDDTPLAGDLAHRRHRGTGSGPGTLPELRQRRGPSPVGDVRQP